MSFWLGESRAVSGKLGVERVQEPRPRGDKVFAEARGLRWIENRGEGAPPTV